MSPEELTNLVRLHLSKLQEIKDNMEAVKGEEWVATAAAFASQMLAMHSVKSMARPEYSDMAKHMTGQHSDSLAFIVAHFIEDEDKAKAMINDAMMFFRHALSVENYKCG